jgi:hypothetical protein
MFSRTSGRTQRYLTGCLSPGRYGDLGRTRSVALIASVLVPASTRAGKTMLLSCLAAVIANLPCSKPRSEAHKVAIDPSHQNESRAARTSPYPTNGRC